MGSFIGHVVPGTFFFLFGFWWIYNVLYRFFYARRFNVVYRNCSSFPIGGACRQSRPLPLESMLKVIAVALGMLGEFFTGFEDGHFTHIGNAQHMTMFFFFGLNGLIDLAYWRKWPLPNKLDYASAILAFTVEAFLFYNHLHGRSHMDIQVHMFLFYTITCCIIFSIIEMAYPRQVLGALCRTVFSLLQGSWFYQIGFILYPPAWLNSVGWNEEDHGQMMIVTLIYTWHLASILILSAFIAFFVWSRVQRADRPKALYQMVTNNYNNDEDEDEHLPTSSNKKKNGHVNNGIIHSNNSIDNNIDIDIDDTESEQEA